jgi:hypothetical protein
MCSQAAALEIRRVGSAGSHPLSYLHFCNAPAVINERQGSRKRNAEKNVASRTTILENAPGIRKQWLKWRDVPSSLLFMLVNGSLESLISRTTSVFVSSAGSMRVNFIICPGNQEGGIGSAGISSCPRAIERAAECDSGEVRAVER